MALSYDWSGLQTALAELKSLLSRVTALEGATAPDVAGLTARLDALETAVSALSAIVASYQPSA